MADFSQLKAKALDLLFARQGALSDLDGSLDQAESEVAAEHGAWDDSAQASWTSFRAQVSREAPAFLADAEQVAGRNGLDPGDVAEAACGFLAGRYESGPQAWALWLDEDLRSGLQDTLESNLSGLSVPGRVAGRLLEALGQRYPTADTPLPGGVPDLPEDAEDMLPGSVLAASRTAPPAARIGSLGRIVFEVGEKAVFTPRSLEQSRKAVFAEHEILDRPPKLQFCGVGLWELSLEILLHARFCDPEARRDELAELQESGEHQPLVLGGQVQGEFVLEDLDLKASSLDARGRMVFATLTLKLKQWAEEEE